MKDSKVKQLVTAALFAALCCVATMVIRIPTIGTSGYVNLGDTVVLMSAWILGGIYGPLAAGIGSAMADLLAGYVTYVPGTFVIKFCMALVASLLFKSLQKTKMNQNVNYFASAVIAELIMIVGYFLYESTLLGYGLAAAASIGSNAVQGGVCLLIGVVLINRLAHVKSLKIVA